ncbi:MAG: glutathione S-transferase family protein [Deltaproteobacteria bacterium]|nr:MAG: glutathione S-transferase family protein [Deltaproteobacteria bacterium]
MKLYDLLESGNGYKVRLLLHQLDVPFERVELDVMNGATRTPEFLALNRNGRIPLLVLDDGTALAESNAIQFYLAEGTPLLPAGRIERALVLQWMFFEQYSHEPYIAVVRKWCHWPSRAPADPNEFAARRARGYDALAVMEDHLHTHDWFAPGRYTIADIALYAYTHVAHEGGFYLEPYPAVRAWLARVRSQPRHIPITQG